MRRAIQTKIKNKSRDSPIPGFMRYTKRVVKQRNTEPEKMSIQAKKGGEFGANGEFYSGGTFIATTAQPKGIAKKKTPKKQEIAPYVWEVAPEANLIAIYPVLSSYIKDGKIWQEVVPHDMAAFILKLYCGKARGRNWFREIDGKIETI